MPKIIAHRGSCKVAPENTIPAFQRAIEDGAEGFECDVHLTADGHVVVCHDHTIDATSNGKGNIADYTLNQLREFDFGSYFSQEFIGTQIPTLDEFLHAAKDVEIINIEIKAPLDGSVEIVKKTLDGVKNFRLEDKTIISSFGMHLLVESKKLEPNVKTGILYMPDTEVGEKLSENLIGYTRSIGADALHPHVFILDEDYIETCHKGGIMVNVWDVNLDFSIKTLAEAGADGIITDYPERAYKLLRV